MTKQPRNYYRPRPRIDTEECTDGLERLLSASRAIVQDLSYSDGKYLVSRGDIHELMKSIDELHRPCERARVWYITQLIRECVDVFEDASAQRLDSGPPFRRPTISHDETTISDPSLNTTGEDGVDPFEEYGEGPVMAWLRESMNLVYVCFDLDESRGGIGKVAVPLSWVCPVDTLDNLYGNSKLRSLACIIRDPWLSLEHEERCLRVARGAERLVHIDLLDPGRPTPKGVQRLCVDGEWWIYDDCCVDLTSIENIHGYANDLYSLVDEGYITREGAARAFGDAAVQTFLDGVL